MKVTELSLKHRTTVFVLVLFVTVAGFYSYLNIPREAAPDITIPYIIITTSYEGVAPSDMETLVTIPLEKKLKGIADVEEIRSTSAEGSSTITIKFFPNVIIDDALQKVRDKVDQVKPELPADADDPEIQEINFSDWPIMVVNISGDMSLLQLKDIAEDLEDRVEAIPGVLDGTITGGLEREIRVEFDIDRVAAYNIPFSRIIEAVERGNINLPGGSLDIGTGKYLLRVPGDFKSPMEIHNLVIFVRDGKPVYLRDVARIVDGFEERTSYSRLDGKESVTLSVQKRSGENVIRITDNIKQIVRDYQNRVPPGVELAITSDLSKDIRILLNDLQNNILSGLVLVLAVIFSFIGGLSALFVAMAIPLSMLIAFGILQALGITLNMVVLFSLILALGMLVDNGIVIVENIYRHMHEGETRIQAAISGTAEVAWPVVTSTLTTLCAFFPLLFWPGIMGEFMSYLPRTLIIALSASLFVALVVNPTFCAVFLKVENPHGRKRERPRVIRGYEAFLQWALEHRIWTLILAFLMLIFAIVAFGFWGKGVEFFPRVEPNRAFVTVKAPEGTNLDASNELVKTIEKKLSPYDDIQYVIATVGAGGSPGQESAGTHMSRVSMDFVDARERKGKSSEIIRQGRRAFRSIVGAEITIKEEEHGPPTGPPVNLEISGDDFETLGAIARQAKERIKDIPGIVDLKDDYVLGKPEIRVEIDKEKASLLGLDTLTIANTVKAAINGIKAGVYRVLDEEIDIIARLPEKDRRSVTDIERLTISDSQGRPIPLTSVARVFVSSGLGSINRIDQKRVVTVQSEVTGRLPNDVLAEIKERLAALDLPRGYAISYTGQEEEQEKAKKFLSKAFVAAIFLIALVLITQFNSISLPLIIMTSVLLSLIGVFWGLLVTGLPFGILMTGIGVISLAGVVVNNAIVLIDYIGQLRNRGLSVTEALIQACTVRFRPVLLTAMTTILGLIPMATGVSFDFTRLRWEIGGESSQWWGPMAVAVIFGLAVATVLTLGVVPTLYSIIEGLRSRFRRVYAT